MRNLHNYLQLSALLLISVGIWQLTTNFWWGALSLGCFLFGWSALGELSATMSVQRRRPIDNDLRGTA